MSVSDMIVMGAVQGFTEFLPVSSSGHLILASRYLDRLPDLSLSVYLHAGTLGATLYYFRKDIFEYLKSLLPNGDAALRKEALLVAVANVPTAAMALYIKRYHGGFLDSYTVALGGFLFTGAVLTVSDRFKELSKQLSFKSAVLMGIAQGVAVLPGISRSGSTIAAGLLGGLSRRDAFRFSFLASIPAVGGAAVLEFLDVKAVSENVFNLTIGVAVSFFVGLVSIELLRRIVSNSRMKYFGAYTVLLAMSGILPAIYKNLLAWFK